MWRAYLADTMTGLIDSPLDLPSFSWSMSIGDFALTTTRGKDVGEGEASGIRVPWDAVPGSTPSARARECFASIFLKQFLHYFSAVWAAGFQQELHHMTAQTRTGTGPPCLYIPET